MEYAKLLVGRAGEGKRQARIISTPHHAAKRFVTGEFVKDSTIVPAPSPTLPANNLTYFIEARWLADATHQIKRQLNGYDGSIIR